MSTSTVTATATATHPSRRRPRLGTEALANVTRELAAQVGKAVERQARQADPLGAAGLEREVRA